MVFSKRMEALADLCQGARRVIDVGCDHAQLCALLVTEYGVADLKYKSTVERARALIAIAHPDFRRELERQMPL